MSKITELEKEITRLQATLDAKQETIDILRDLLVQEQPNPFGLGQIPSVRPNETPWVTTTQGTGGLTLNNEGCWTATNIEPQIAHYCASTKKPSGLDNSIIEGQQAKPKKPMWTDEASKQFHEAFNSVNIVD